MTRLISSLSVINADEPCYSLKELNLQAPDYSGFRRYRILLVMPNARLQAEQLVVDSQHLREFWYDLGPAEGFKLDQLGIIGGVPLGQGMVEIVETVGRLNEMAERIHANYLPPVERPEPTDLKQRYLDQRERKRRERKRQSTFGYGGAVQRVS